MPGRTLLGIMVTVLLSACGGPPASSGPPATGTQEPFLAHHDVADFAGQIRRGTPGTPGGCVGITRHDGSTMVLLWPLGWELDPDGRGVLDPSGSLAAAFGAGVEVGGTDFEGQARLLVALDESGVRTRCPDREHFFVSEVITGP